MKRVYSDIDALRAGIVASVLEEAGIACTIRNQYLGGAVGELPVNECWPEVWVIEDADVTPALRLIDGVLDTAAEPGPPWVCAGCGERLEAQFDQCWRCGGGRAGPT